ncbi:hypothetical protein UlMin_004386 [Ulmus minor]
MSTLDHHSRPSYLHRRPPKMSMTKLLKCKHLVAWVKFEKGMINEVGLAKKFFKDGRPFDLEGLKDCMKIGYSYLESVEELLCSLRQNNYEMYAFTNYPIMVIYLGQSVHVKMVRKRNLDPDFLVGCSETLEVDPANCIFSTIETLVHFQKSQSQQSSQK